MDLTRISKVKRDAITEALQVWNMQSRNTFSARKNFTRQMKERGWNYIGSGCYKICLAKGSIVAKYLETSLNVPEFQNEIKKEVDQWNMAPSKFKKYLPRIYSFDKGLIVQDKVLVKCNEGYCAGLHEITQKFPDRLYDYHNNHGHTLRGTVKFYDWVYNRKWDLVEHPHKKFIR